MSFKRLDYRPIANPNNSMCYAITPIQLLISSQTLRKHLTDLSDSRLAPLKNYYNEEWWRMGNFDKWCKWFEDNNTQNAGNGGDPEHFLTCFLLPAIYHDLQNNDTMENILLEIGYTDEWTRCSYTYNQNYKNDLDLFISMVSQLTTLKSDNVYPSCWLANIYTPSKIHHAINIVNTGDYYVIIDEDRIITTLDDWMKEHDERFERMDVIGYGCKMTDIAKQFNLKASSSIHKQQFEKAFITDGPISRPKIITTLGITITTIAVIAIIIISILHLKNKAPISSSSLSESLNAPPVIFPNI